MRRSLVLLSLLILAALPRQAAGQVEQPVTWALDGPRGLATAGERLELTLTAQIEEGWKLYSTTQPPGGPIATTIRVGESSLFKLDSPATGPAPRQDFDPNFSMETEYYDEAVTFRIPVRVAAGAPAGTHAVQVLVRFQACDEHFCLPPRTDTLTLNVGVRASTAVAAPGAAETAAPSTHDAAPPAAPAPRSAPVEEATPAPVQTDIAPVPELAPSASEPAAAGDVPVFGGETTGTLALSSFIWLAMSVGALSLLTPCVFPMVPITVSYFTKHAAGRRRAAVGNAFVYSAGIILTFTALGMLLALVVGASGLNRFAASPWLNLLIAGIFLAFAMNLFGAFELNPPASLLTRLDAMTRREGGSRLAGTLLMGLTFTLTSFTCTAPFVGTLLVMASQGDWLWPLIGMLAFSTVFAAPFFVLALVPQLVSQLPKAGGWLNAVKVSMGFLEVAAAMKFLSNVDLVWNWGILTREVVLASWIALGLLLSLYLIGTYRLTNDSPTERIGGWRLASAIVSLALTLHLLTGLFGSRLGEIEAFLPPATPSSSSARGAGTLDGELPWMLNDFDGALAQARREERLVLVDFTGYTCTNCRWMEANMFPRPDVKRELEAYVRVKLYTDGEGEMYERQQELQARMFKTVALPYYAVVTPDAAPVITFPGLTRKPEQFVAFLQVGLGKLARGPDPSE